MWPELKQSPSRQVRVRTVNRKTNNCRTPSSSKSLVGIKDHPKLTTYIIVSLSRTLYSFFAHVPYAGASNAPSRTTQKNQPVPISELVPKSAFHSKFTPDENGIVAVETPLPSLAYLFMLPFPFFCMGCCLFRQSKLVFDENTRLIKVTVRKGACPCSTQKTFSYNDIGNVAVVRTTVRIDGVRMHETLILLRDSTKIRTGRLESKEGAFAFAKEIHHFIFGRSDNNYIPPTMSDLLLSTSL